MSTEVHYISNVCVMGKKNTPQFKRELAALIYNFTCGIEKIEKCNGTMRQESISSRHKRINSFPLDKYS